MTRSPEKLIPADFTAIPSRAWVDGLRLTALDELDESAGALGITIAASGDLPAGVPLDRAALDRAGFAGSVGQTLVLPQPSGPLLVLVGTGDETDAPALRNAGASFARAAVRAAHIGLRVTLDVGDVEHAAQAITEGVILARYAFVPLKTVSSSPALEAFDLDVGDRAAAGAGMERARVAARATVITRDLANTPPGHLTASDLADIAVELGPDLGFEVESFDKEALIELGCGGLLGVNAGSVEEPRMIVLRYAGDGGPSLAMVGKGIMYDSGGISLKPSDPMHLLMKMDMGGAAAVLGAFTALRDTGVTASVSAWLMCTDNMPSGSAYKLGDVLTARGGKTVEVKNTDAEGRLAMMDGLALAAEEKPDAIVDIATLTGAALMALGQLRAALFGNDQALLDQVKSASETTDEQVWQLPLERAYRKQLDSDVADISNLGGRFAGSTTAALFLEEFVAGIPWAHVDIAGTMQADSPDRWLTAGATGYGARLLLALAQSFTVPATAADA
ncbi:leucyl aminopeptidase [Glaciibacter flavus]|uniref:Probable cytosol aminopeptidase n=1 Tax=Orlajensenia flava TaxID=2565934 RepID=A0A4S4FW10_9MICO|nr:leucyl aminopeptidase [Glaciibacter flavus]THG34481.1 leucyl aminopeptidase [Glaciibacter flavus]